MIRAVLRNGTIHPLDPVPNDWGDGRELLVDEADTRDDSPEAINKEFAELNALASQNDPEEDERLQVIVREIRHKERELARRRAGMK